MSDKSRVYEFFAYETVGAAIAHCASIVRTDDPELMAAIVKAEAEGKILISDDGEVTIVNPVERHPDEMKD